MRRDDDNDDVVAPGPASTDTPAQVRTCQSSGSPLPGLVPKQIHQSGCSECLFRHAFMKEGLAGLHAQSQSPSPSRNPN